MPVTKITANGTYQLKTDPGYVTSLSVPNAGTAWTLQIFDAPGRLNPTASYTLFGGAAGGTLTTGTALLAPLYFGNGLQLILAGTAGELDVQWY
jgi:hypothetical protein